MHLKDRNAPCSMLDAYPVAAPQVLSEMMPDAAGQLIAQLFLARAETDNVFEVRMAHVECSGWIDQGGREGSDSRRL